MQVKRAETKPFQASFEGLFHLACVVKVYSAKSSTEDLAKYTSGSYRSDHTAWSSLGKHGKIMHTITKYCHCVEIVFLETAALSEIEEQKVRKTQTASFPATIQTEYTVSVQHFAFITLMPG